MKKPKIGDVIEIDGTDGCLYYARYTHQHPVFGGLLRIYNFRAEPSGSPNIEKIVSLDIVNSIFYPLRHSIKIGVFRIVGNAPLHEGLEAFPVFRTGYIDPATGETKDWWLWDGTREWRVGRLEQPDRYPLRQVVNDTYLREFVQAQVRP
jgi:hypothetical protein